MSETKPSYLFVPGERAPETLRRLASRAEKTVDEAERTLEMIDFLVAQTGGDPPAPGPGKYAQSASFQFQLRTTVAYLLVYGQLKGDAEEVVGRVLTLDDDVIYAVHETGVQAGYRQLYALGWRPPAEAIATPPPAAAEDSSGV